MNKQQNPDKYEVTFDASALSSGVYLYTITSGSFMQTRKMLLMK
ncbi:MAG: T9SS type A sorting domain-containing protein [Ignavibacterium sp.]|nr:T9SS type A sorting domain-containing protein [Ignavibacterium sp.]